MLIEVVTAGLGCSICQKAIKVVNLMIVHLNHDIHCAAVNRLDLEQQHGRWKSAPQPDV